jgi:S-DNA-T family DNA segregation ATPase FtsK/SpoIIIE
VPELILRLRLDDDQRDLIAVVEPGHTVAELASAIAAHVGREPPGHLCSERLGCAFSPELTIDRIDLVTGDVVGFGVSAPRPPSSEPALAVDVVAGPESGRSWAIGRSSRHTIGRAPSADIVLDDPSVSRDHAVLLVDAAGVVTVDPLPAAVNGVCVNDIEIDAPATIIGSDVVALGGTRVVVRAIERRGQERIGRLGQIDFHRTPYRPTIVADREIEPFGPIPESIEPRRLQLLAVLAPLLAGATMFAFTRRVHFLALTLVSPLVMVGTAFEDRRRGRRRGRERIAVFRTALSDRRAEILRRRDEERRERFRAAPDLPDLIRRAELRTIDLWARGRHAPDFLRVRLGLGPAAVRFSVALERGGDERWRDEARRALIGLDTLDGVPVTVDLSADTVLGLHGESALVDGVAASLVVQAATLHSPDDLTICGVIGPDRPLAWLAWLPHARSVTSPIAGNHVVVGRPAGKDAAGHPIAGGAADLLVGRLLETAAFRLGDRADRSDGPRWPRILLLVDGSIGLDPVEVARLLDLAPAAGISVVWLAATAGGVPRQATRVVALRRGTAGAMVGRLWSTDPEIADRVVEVEHLRAGLADRAARALAPVRDASTTSLATSIPRQAPLLDVLGIGKPSPSWVAEHWHVRDGDRLRCPIGFDAQGPLHLDLVADGPHALIGGTSGAGKSELLQSLVTSLAVHHPPTRLNFLFVDYKGGASSHAFERLPHTVGHVTNLTAGLALRALTSLRAELERRMAVLQDRAKDLAEMLAVAPDETPPSLVIVVDEFATLVAEVPEFVAGMIDIAQRGRSLGIHLVLATQRPTGSVDERILANTNLRIALRMIDRADSTAVIGSPDAADIPVPLRGRGLVRLGSQRLVEFQSAFGGAALTAGDVRAPVLVGDFDATDASPRRPLDPTDGRPSQLTVVIDAIVEAAARLELPTPRRPWRDPLPGAVLLDEVLTDRAVAAARRDPGRLVVVGLLDDPDHQDQRPLVLDLEDGGGCVVVGAGGSGKTTFLRTVAASLTVTAGPSAVAIVVFDLAARGLVGLRRLPAVVEVATGDDAEAVTRNLLVLEAEMERRHRLLAAPGGCRVELPRVVVLVDGTIQATGLDAGGGVAGEWTERLVRLVTDGRQVGIHTIVAVDRRGVLSARLMSAVSNRIVLRHADESGYAEHGIGPVQARRLDLPPGRGVLPTSLLVQLACVSRETTGHAQTEAIAELAGRMSARDPTPSPALVSAPLPDVVTGLPAADEPMAPWIGLADVVGAPVRLDLSWSNAAVCGPPRSGRSTALAVLAAQLAGRCDVHVVGRPSSPLDTTTRTLTGITASFGPLADLAEGLDRLANLAAMDAPSAPVRVLIVDDADALDDLGDLFDRLVRCDGLRLVVGLETRSMCGYTANPLVQRARQARRLLVLQPDDPGEFLQSTGVKLALRPGLRRRPGRGVLLVDRVPTVVQVASASSGPSLPGVVAEPCREAAAPVP